jgi:hypothetical protein
MYFAEHARTGPQLRRGGLSLPMLDIYGETFMHKVMCTETGLDSLSILEMCYLQAEYLGQRIDGPGTP